MSKADMFLKLVAGAPINGESAVPEHKDEIEIFGFEWGITGSQGLGGKGAMVKTALAEMTFFKQADKATPNLMKATRENKVVSEAKLSVRKAGVVPPVDYLVITLKKGRISNYNIGTKEFGSPTVVESFSIAFEEIEVTGAAQSADGTKKAPVSFNASVN